MRGTSLLLLFLFGLLVAALFGPSCANIIPPAGGPRDSIPPRLLSAEPRDSSVNFRGDRIQLNFDEYVDLQDLSNNVLFTPLFTSNPPIDVRGKAVTIRFERPLEPNTTYILNFGNAIKDYNEGNVLRNFTYTFSTGPALDSLELQGQVLLAETGGIDTTLMVVLHRNLSDSAVRNETPQYITRLDREGRFRFSNLPADTFAVYAFSDPGRSRRYLNDNQVFAFADTFVITGVQDTVPLLYAYRRAAAPQPPTTAPGNRAVTNRVENRLIVTNNLKEDRQDLNGDLVLSFATPLRTLDTTALLLTYDTVFTRTAYRATLDSARRQLRIQAAWREGTPYNLILGRDFATDTAGRRLLKTDTLFFRTKSAEDYADVNIRLKTVDLSRNPVLLFVQADKVVYSAPVPNGTFVQRRFLPGDYELRILYDTNGNGRWDPGHFFGGRVQPERVITLPQRVTIKGGADNEFER
jgi:hypothetical protein